MSRRVWLKALGLGGALALTGGTALAATGWTQNVVPSTGNNVVLNGVFARTNSDAWAVGQQFVAAGQPQAPAAAYHWNGSAWSLTPTPNLGFYGALSGVSASSANDAWAVGFTHVSRRAFGTLIEHWDGSKWSAASVNAVEGFGAGLTGVVDLGPSDAWAAGHGPGGGLLEHWNGSTWSAVPLPDSGFVPANITPLAATSANDIWLVGSSSNASGTTASGPEALHFDGTTWSVVPVARNAGDSVTLQSVAALSASDAWAVGLDLGANSLPGGSTLIEHWDGSAWRIVPSPTPGADPSLNGVAVRSATDAIAVGTTLPSINGGPLQTMILRWNGSTWSQDGASTFGGSLSAAATFPGASTEWAVGFASPGDQGLILSHN